MNSWGLVMTAREPAALVEVNVRWHLATGAAAVHVFLDDPTDPARAVLEAIPGCTVTCCDAAHWESLHGAKGRPASQMRRQTLNANKALALAATDWLFHIDADEFIWQDGDFAKELADHHDPQIEVNLPVLERIFPDGPQQTLFDGAFRATSEVEDPEAAFGPFAAMMKRGQYSHGAGKSGVRATTALSLGVHNATRTRKDGTVRRARKAVSRTARLLHFDGMTPLHWVMKAARYRENPARVAAKVLQPHRQAQLDWMAVQPDLMAAHRAMFALTEDRRARLEGAGLLHRIPFAPQEVLGGACPDLSAAAFDAALRAR
ncbi:MAG: glycosyltransferase family 2 protein [Pseudomonadota bacterium]